MQKAKEKQTHTQTVLHSYSSVLAIELHYIYMMIKFV